MSERVDTLLGAVGFVLVVGSSLFAGRVAWRFADRVVDWIAANRPVRARRVKSVAKARPSARREPTVSAAAPSEHPAVEDIAQARAAVRRDARIELRLAEQGLLAAAFQGDRRQALHAQRVIDHHRLALAELGRAEGSR